MMENAIEYFCWVRVVNTGHSDGDDLAPGERLSDAVLEKLAPERAAEYLRTTCPRVTWHETVYIKRPPAPPVRRSGSGWFEQRTRQVLDFQPLTTMHLEQPVQEFDLHIDANPIFGGREEAMRWIESEAGEVFSKPAKAMTLICFTVLNGRMQAKPVAKVTSGAEGG